MLVSVPEPRFLRFHGTGSGTSVVVLTSEYKGSVTRFSEDYLHYSHFGTSSVAFRLHFNFKSTLNQVEPIALVLEPKLAGT